MDAETLSRHYGDVFFLAFLAIALWEAFRPRVRETYATVRRWGQHGTLVALATIIGVTLRLSPLAVAAAVSASPWGLLNRPSLPPAARFVVALLLIDLFHYAAHRLTHAVPFLWRVHQVHHADDHFDLTTGLRFHPLEFLVTQLPYLGFVAVIAPPIEAAAAAELAIIVQNLFSHANVRLPIWCHGALRRVLITPDVHRLHHSLRLAEQNTNFGVVLPLWDRLFGTYLGAPLDGRDSVRVGLRELDGAPRQTILSILAMPFRLKPLAGSAPARPLQKPHVAVRVE